MQIRLKILPVEFRQMKFHRGFCRVNLADKIPNRVPRFGILRRFLKFGISSEILLWISLRFRDKILYRLQISALPHADYRAKSGEPSGRRQSFMNARGRVRLGYRALSALFGCRQSFRRAYLRHRGDLVRRQKHLP